MINIIEPKIQISKQRQIFTNKNLKNLIIPLIIEQLLVLLVGIADTLMVSYAGEAAVSGVSLVNQLNNVFLYIFNALASGGAVVASQYIGNKDQKNGNLAASQLVMITTVISVFLMLFAILLREQLLTLLFGDVESDVMSACLTYLIISALSWPVRKWYPVSRQPRMKKQRNRRHGFPQSSWLQCPSSPPCLVLPHWQPCRIWRTAAPTP